MQNTSKTERKARPHRAWSILVAACCLYGGTAGFINNCRGIFFAPASASLGVSATSYANYLTFGCITGVASMPLISRLFRRLPIKRILTAYLFLMGLSTAALGWVRTLPQCYAVGAAQGLFISFVANYPAAYLVKQWFVKKKGLAMGIATASAGVIGAIMNIVYDHTIMTIGWRASYLLMGIGSFLVGAIPVLLLVQRSPKDLGLLPYGAEEEGETAPAAPSDNPAEEKTRLRPAQLVPFLLIFFIHATVNLSNTYVQHVPNYLLGEGLSSTVGAALLSVAMLSGVAAKLVYGSLADRLGVFRAAMLMTAPLLMGFLLLLLGGGRLPLLVLAGICVSTVYSLIAIQGPLLLDAFYAGAHYESLLAVLITAAAIFSMGGNFVVDLLYGLGGGYRLGFFVICLLLALCIGICLLLARMKKNRT